MLKRLVGYAAYMFGANTVTGLLTFAVSTLGMVSRPKEAFGDYATYMRVYEIGQGLFIYGANASIQRFAADSDENRTLFSALALRVFFVLLVGMSVLGLAAGLSLDWTYAFALFGLPWLVLYWWGRYIVRSKLDARREARLMMIASLSNSVYQLLFLTFTDYRDALIYGDVLALVTSGIAAVVYISAGQQRSILELLRIPVPRQLLREAIAFAKPVWWSGQLFQARHQTQSVWTAAKLGAAPMGALQGMMTFWQFAAKPLELVGQAALPGLVAAKEGRSELFREVLRMCLVAFGLIGVAVAAGMPLVFQLVDAIRALLGKDGEPFVSKYGEVPGLLRVLAVMMPVYAFDVVSNQYSVAEGRPRMVLYSNIATVVAVGASIYPLTSSHGLTGVVLSGALGTAASAATYATVLWRDYPRDMRAGTRWTLWATAAAIATMAPSQLYAAWPWSWVLSFPAVLCYLALMFAAGLVGREDVGRVVRAVRQRAA